MKTYLKFREQLEAAEDVKEMLKTLEKIAAANIHFLEEKTNYLRNYVNCLEEISSYFSKESENNGDKKGENVLLVVTGDEGLVGGLWHRIIEEVLRIKKDYKKIFSFGEKGKSLLEEEGVRVEKSFLFGKEIFDIYSVNNIRDFFVSNFEDGNFKKVDIIFPSFVNIMRQEPKLESFLPFHFPSVKQKEAEGIPLYEPSRKKIFSFLKKQYISVKFYQIVLEAKLSDFSARTVWSENSFAKLEKMIKNLRINYLKERRFFISQKQTETFTVHKLCRKM